MKRILALSLGLMLIMSLFVSCGGGSGTDATQPTGDIGGDIAAKKFDLVGTWEATTTLFDIANFSREFAGNDSGSGGASSGQQETEAPSDGEETEEEKLDFTELNNILMECELTYIFTATEDGTYTLKIDSTSYANAVNGFVEGAIKRISLEAEKNGLSAEEYLTKRKGYTVEAYKTELKNCLSSPAEESGSYSLNGNLLTLGSKTYSFSSDDSESFSLTDSATEVYVDFYKA